MDDLAKTKRSCGECTLCCTSVAVAPLAKPTGTPCRHVCATGCKIYEARIAECRGFSCLWLDGWFEESDRPDELGVVFFEEPIKDGPNLIAVSEASPGAAGKSARVKELIRKFLEHGISVVVRNEQTVTKAQPDGQLVRYAVDQSDPLKVAVVPETLMLRRTSLPVIER